MYKVWLLKFPLHAHYKESEKEISELAKKAGLEIIDAKYASEFDKSHLVDMSEEPALTSLVAKGKPESPPNDEERELRDKYEQLYGKKAGGRMSLETLRQKVQEASE